VHAIELKGAVEKSTRTIEIYRLIAFIYESPLRFILREPKR